jgi:hypothetical protein
MAAVRFIQRHGIALLALFIALGGTAYAAGVLPPNSIGPKHLKKNAVTRPKVAANAVNGAKIANDSVTGADVLESSLTKVASAVRADSATNATHADVAATAVSAAHADNTAHADTADKLDGVAAADWQKRVSGTCPSTQGIQSIATNGSVTCVSPIAKLSFIVPNAQVSDPPGPTSSLHLGAGCNVPGTFVAFVNTGSSAATLNWIYSDGTTVSASGAPLPAGSGEVDLSFQNARIEGQFVFANSAGVTTVNLHAFDGEAGGCEIRGTAEGS